MSDPAQRHLDEMRRNMAAWGNKPLLREIYSQFYRRIERHLDPALPGPTVEIGSGIGNLKSQRPQALATDIFPNPWLDLACDAYRLPFKSGCVSHLVLFDVFHHLQAPMGFLAEAERVLVSRGRVILFEPFVSLCSRAAYGLFHHEPLAMSETIDLLPKRPNSRSYYAAQGNATRMFFGARRVELGEPWRTGTAEAFSCFHYLLSGGYSKPSVYPRPLLPMLLKLDRFLSRWPTLFAGRCLVVIEKRT